ncbi:hypothetical protein TeGR_g189 [Tetraparma gracilis]|uniref:Mediator of RNA polymerase II transcription subunit 6 n=1 Tax=Tetraparma gracilis TaxID=2962635 RepID=A0ABQ6N371_9STRA|nr:hypothetical protein TeGR_g189 [Tetraparma gracilis]
MTITFIDPIYLSNFGLLPLTSLLSYALHPANPLRPILPHPTCNEELLKQGVHDYQVMERRMVRMTGAQIILAAVPPPQPDPPPPPGAPQQPEPAPNLFTITYIHRQSPSSYSLTAAFYCSAGEIFPCPRADAVLHSSLGRCALHLGKAGAVVGGRRGRTDVGRDERVKRARAAVEVPVAEREQRRRLEERGAKGRLLGALGRRVGGALEKARGGGGGEKGGEGEKEEGVKEEGVLKEEE